jgi:hypothetical protein
MPELLEVHLEVVIFVRIFLQLNIQGFVCGEDLYCWR